MVLNNGLIVIWGKVLNIAANSWITFPISFTAAPTVNLSRWSDSSGTGTYNSVLIRQVTTTQMLINKFTTDIYCMYSVIGY